MEPDFDFSKFLRRKNMKQREAASFVGASMGLIGSWASKKAVPSYEKAAKLIECGITAQELFGEELGCVLVNNSQPLGKLDKSEFKEGVREALVDILNLKKSND